jgi:hypothetical protein
MQHGVGVRAAAVQYCSGGSLCSHGGSPLAEEGRVPGVRDSEARWELRGRARRADLPAATEALPAKPEQVSTRWPATRQAASAADRSTEDTGQRRKVCRAYGPSFMLRSGILRRSIPGTRPTYGRGTSGSGPAAFAVPWRSCTFSLRVPVDPAGIRGALAGQMARCSGRRRKCDAGGRAHASVICPTSFSARVQLGSGSVAQQTAADETSRSSSVIIIAVGSWAAARLRLAGVRPTIDI